MEKPNLPDWAIEIMVGVFIGITIIAPFAIHLAFEYLP